MGSFSLDVPLDTINVVNTQYIEPSLIDEIHEIEQDVWGRFLGEYRECLSCLHIYSKEEVFGSFDLNNFGVDIKNNTIKEIERALDFKEFQCVTCKEETNVIFGENFKKEILSRHDFEKSFLLLHRSVNGRLLGYIDAYISDFETVYDRELDHYYSKLGREEILRKIEKTLGHELPGKIICLSGVGNTPDSASMKNLYQLEKAMVEEVSEYNPNLTGIYESVIGSCAHTILDICNAKRIGISKTEHLSCNENYYSDIFVHENMPLEGIKGLGSSFKSFFKTNKARVRELRK